MDNALQGLEEANVAAEQGKRYFMDALKRAKSMRKNRLHRRPVSELCVFDDFEKSDQALMFEHVLKQRKELKRQILRSYPLLNKRPRSNDPILAVSSDMLQNVVARGKIREFATDKEKVDSLIKLLNKHKEKPHTQLPMVLDSIIQLVTLFQRVPSEEFLLLRNKLYNTLFSIMSKINENEHVTGSESSAHEYADAIPLACTAISLILYLVNERNVGGESASKQFIELAIKLLKIRVADVLNFESNTYRIFKTKLRNFTGQNSHESIIHQSHIPYIKQSKHMHCDLILLRFLSIHNFENDDTECNDSSKRFQNIFKHEFRQLGGMEVILSWMQVEIQKFTAFVEHIPDNEFKIGPNLETKTELPSQSILRMTMILKLFESLSLSCDENREKMSRDQALVTNLTRLIFICSIYMSQVAENDSILSIELVLVCTENAMRVLINITNGSVVAVQNVAKVIVSANVVVGISRSGIGAIVYALQLGIGDKYTAKNLEYGTRLTEERSFSIAHFDMSVLALALLTNCLEHYVPPIITINTLQVGSDETSLIEYLTKLFSKCRNFRKAQEAIRKDEFVILEGHLGLLFACMSRRSVYRNEILNRLPNKSFETLDEAVALFAKCRENYGMHDSCIHKL